MMRVGNRAGFSMVELLVVVGIIGALGIGIPLVLPYLQSQTAIEGARELQTRLSRAKQLAVTTRQSICVQPNAGGYQFLQGGCAGVLMTFPEAPAGTFTPSNNVTVALASGSNPIFTPFGTVTQTGVFNVTVPRGPAATVTVNPSGRITIP